jgi:hypothetical protein
MCVRVCPCSCKWQLLMPLTHLLPVTSRSLARDVDGIYRESGPVGAQLARGLPDDVTSSGEGKYYDALGSGGVSYARAARLYSETARITISQKSNTFVVIASICVASIPATILTSF